MLEGRLLSKIEIVKRVAEAEKVVSQVRWEGNDCLPRAVALTHGYPTDFHSLGLYARATVQEAMDASKIVAERSGENVSIRKFIVKGRRKTQSRIGQLLNESDKAWLFFGG